MYFLNRRVNLRSLLVYASITQYHNPYNTVYTYREGQYMPGKVCLLKIIFDHVTDDNDQYPEYHPDFVIKTKIMLILLLLKIMKILKFVN